MAPPDHRRPDADCRSDHPFAASGGFEVVEGIGRGGSIDGSSADGFVWARTDTYRFTGELEPVELDGEAAVYVDGERIDDDETATGADHTSIGRDLMIPLEPPRGCSHITALHRFQG